MTQSSSHAEQLIAPSTTDAELLHFIAEGNLHAIGVLYDRHVATLFPIAARILRDAAESEDVIHDAFVQVQQRANQYVVGRGSVLAWLTTLVRNLTIDHLRRRNRQGALAREFHVSEPRTPSVGPEQLLMTGGARASVQRALAKLPETQRSTLYVAFYEGLTYAEIAEREGVPVGTIKSRAARAIAALREALATA
jgi:RNA polymerase sigma-70 factor (ECF subfamily)